MTNVQVHRVVCAVPGCGVPFMVDMFDPRFPTGPFFCRDHRRSTVGAVAHPDDDDHAVTLDELDADGVVASVTVNLPKKW